MKKLLLPTTILSMAAFTVINAKIAFTAPLKKTGSRRNVIFLEDAQQKRFVLKNPRSTEHAIHETLATTMGKKIDISINDIEILPNRHSLKNYFPERSTQNNAMTLHERVPGSPVSETTTINEEIDMFGGLSSQSNLNSIIKSKALCEIAAHNTYVNDIDCSNEHLFLDNKTNQFYAIDKDQSFGYALGSSNELPKNLMASQSYDFLEELKNKDLSAQEIKALKRFNKTLDKSIYNYPPEKIQQEWMHIAHSVNYSYTPSKQAFIKKALEHSFNENKRLKSQLDKVIKIQEGPAPFILKKIAQPSKKAQHDFWRTMNS